MIAFVKELALEAGKICLKERETLSKRDLAFKNPRDLVTTVDRKVENFLITRIQDRYPGHAIFGEETGHKSGTQDFRWIIDPIDGTTSYFHNQPFYGVSIALEEKGELMLGVVYAPVLDQLFHAEAGQGAFLDGQPIRVSATKELGQAVMATGFACIREGIEPNNLPHFNRIVPKLRDIRRFGSAALDLCYVACGRLDGFWEMNLNLYDIAAGVLIVREAGGKITDFTDGENFPQNGIAAANPILLPLLTELLL